MPRLDATMTSQAVPGSNYNYQATRIGDLGATEYTLVTVAVDVTGSVYGFEQELLDMLVTAVQSCQKSPRSGNLMLRALTFSSAVGVNELHGFKPLSEIDATAYGPLQVGGATPLTDTLDASIGAMADYGTTLYDNDFLANGIVFVITDGCDNCSTATPAMVKRRIEQVRRGEELESLVTVLVGINEAGVGNALTDYQRACGLDHYIAAGNATRGKLAKLAAFVSQSVSSQSQALGTGGPSQAISATI